jgi:hypothetical protein
MSLFEGPIPEAPPGWKETLDDLGMTEHFQNYIIPESFDDVLADGNWEVIFNA